MKNVLIEGYVGIVGIVGLQTQILFSPLLFLFGVHCQIVTQPATCTRTAKSGALVVAAQILNMMEHV